MKQKSNILFANKSQKIFTKIKFVNALTSKEISILNTRYMNLGLHIKQVVVDSFGEEEIKKKSSYIDLLGKKRNRKEFNSLNSFLYNYYGKEKLLSNKKYKEYKNSNLSEKENNKKYSKEELSELLNALNSIKKDVETIEYKNCVIETDEFKLIIIDYISKFRKYISKEEYSFLLKKWKNELSKIKGIDLFDFNKIDNFMNWKISILKGLKSEIVLYAISNICDNLIKGKNNNNNVNKNIENNINNEKMKRNEEENKKESSDSELSDDEIEENNFNRNDTLLLQCIKNANIDEENL